MFAQVFSEIINNKLPLLTVQKWLCGENQTVESIECTKNEFVNNFLSFIHLKNDVNLAKILSVKKIPIQTALRLEDRLLKEPIAVHSTPIKKRTKIELKPVESRPMITHKQFDRSKLNQLIDLYCFLIERKLVANIFNEFEFLVSLMSSTYANQMLKRNEILADSESCVYFAINCLMYLVTISSSFSLFFDMQMLKFLHDFANGTVSIRKKDRVLKSLDLKMNSSSILNTSTSTSVDLNKSFNESATNTLICHFDSDLNSLANFPSAKACQKFCKQRDQFFRIYEEWSTKRFDPNWQFSSKLGAKIGALIVVDLGHPDDCFDDTVNLMHFGRLFLSQLLKTAATNAQQQQQQHEINSIHNRSWCEQENTDLKSRLDRAKFEKLEKRIVSNSNGAACDDFFFEFVRVAINCSFLFVRFLIDQILVELVEQLNDAIRMLTAAATTASATKDFDLLSFLKSMKLMAR